ncbi:MAG: hypothetical protein FJ222_00910 [Lentisphaerae bacterium]|nr:hypothetical protein [Lentisphaerota bacterium]
MQDPGAVIEVDETGEPITRVDLQLEREKIQLERERMALEREKLVTERERWKLEDGWRQASERVVKIRMGTVFLIGACCILLGYVMGGIWLASQQEHLREKREAVAAHRRQELVRALRADTNSASRAETLLQTLQGRDGSGGILLFLD